MRPHETYFFNFIIIINLIIILILGGILIIYPQFTGHAVITAQGGNITNLNLTGVVQAMSWSIIYGNMSNESYTDSMELYGGEIKGINVDFINETEERFILASPAQNININNIQPANLTFLDEFLGLSASSAMSGTNTFLHFSNYTINNNTYEVYTLKTNSISGDYVQALFKIGEVPIIITKKVINGTGFNHQKHDFQFMLPIKAGEVNDYYFKTFPYESDLNCSVPFNLNAEMKNNYSDIILSWDEIPGAESYTLYYYDNLTIQKNKEKYEFNFSDSNKYEGITGTNFTQIGIIDTQKERIYTIEVVSKGNVCNTTERAGFINVDLYRIENTRYNLISNPFFNDNQNIKEIIKPILYDFEQALFFDTEKETFLSYMSTYLPGVGFFSNDKIINNITDTSAIWVVIHENTTLPLAGKLRNYTNFTVYKGFNYHGFHYLENRSISNAFYEIRPYISTRVNYRYDNSLKSYETYAGGLIGGNWYPSPTNSIEYINLVDGFFINTGQEYYYEIK